MDDDEVPELISSAPAELLKPDKRVPITLICGFLGAGKTTLLKRILSERHGYKIAVIMNEFGDTADIEGRAIKVASAEDPNGSLEQATEEFLELPNGCLCCSIKDTGVAAIEKLMTRKGSFDHILLETTGLADPAPIAAMFWQNEEYAMGLGKDIYLDGVICVVDAVFAEKQIQEDAEFEGINHSLRQIGAADVLLLNKVDLVSQFQLVKTENILRAINPAIPIHRTMRAQIDLSVVMGLGAYSDPDRSQAFLEKISQSTLCDTHDHNHEHEDGNEHASHFMPHGGISSIISHVPGPLNDAQIVKLDEWIRSVLWDNRIPPEDVSQSFDDLPSPPLEILRCKGFWWNNKKTRFMLQGVRNLYEVSEIPESSDEKVGVSSGKLVFIGKGLTAEVEASLARIFRPPV
ncbi:CobW domain-containing protein [Hysterangium stoloniferum]|nr:CobW domain-containing protein [Hysterangium stoloniferum]